jgi:hypothetical protein
MKRVSVLGLLILCATGASAADCDRGCLKNMMTTYLNALVAQDPSNCLERQVYRGFEGPEAG